MYMRATWDLHGTYTGFTWDPCRTNMYVLHKDLHGIRTGSHGSYMGTAWELHGSYMGTAWDHMGATWDLYGTTWELHGNCMGATRELHAICTGPPGIHTDSCGIPMDPLRICMGNTPHPHGILMGSTWIHTPPPPPQDGSPSTGVGQGRMCVNENTNEQRVNEQRVLACWAAPPHNASPIGAP